MESLKHTRRPGYSHFTISKQGPTSLTPASNRGGTGWDQEPPPPPQGKVRGWQRHEGSRTQMVESSLSSDLRKSPRRKLVLTGRHREGALGIWEPLNC